MQDRKVVLAVVYLLGAVALVGLAGTILLATTDTDAGVLAVVAGLAGTATGGLVGLLANTRTTETPTPVTVENPPADPVPVAETPKRR